MGRPSLLKPYLALASVCFFWGTTYLGIRMALESFPPLPLVAFRFLISGTLMTAFAMARGSYLPKGRDLLRSAFAGLLTLGVGNCAVVFSETFVPSGIVGLIITISPFWLVGVEALLPGGEGLHAPTIGGMLVGLAGTALLFTPHQGAGGIDRNLLAGFLMLQVGMASWSFGSIIQRRKPGRAHPVVAAGIQQLAAGLGVLPFALIIPQQAIHWNVRGVGAAIYLIIFGSMVGFSSYAYALDRLPVAVVSIYPYINAVVAVTLGSLIYREAFGIREALAMAVIFAGVALVKRYSIKRANGV